MFLASCQDNESTNPSNEKKGTLRLDLTDAPIDNPSVKACVVTVANVYVDNVKLEGFNKTTVDLLALQNGTTKNIGEFELENKTYSSIQLELDFEKTESGESPGAYVELQDGTKDAIMMTENTLSINSNFDIVEENSKKLVIDFDLRKSIKDASNDSQEADYNFTSQLEIKNALRLVDTEESGIIKGKASVGSTETQNTIVLAYNKGQFNQSTELSAQGESNLLFANAVSSTSCDEDGNYELHFLPKGEYEIYVAKYEANSNNKMEFSGLFSLDGVLSLGSPKLVTVEAESSANVDLELAGLLEL